MSRVFWDTNLFIYLFEDYGALSQAVVQLRSRMLARGDQLLTSTLTLGEILVKPAERKDAELCRKYEHAIATAAIMIAFDVKAAKVYATLRSERSLKAPDAIQLSCAASANVDLFVTNDERLHERYVDGIQFIVPLARTPI
ncbi:MAG TPA: type II toxin-antitoxin system VapC family toxin [Terriglobales bacterium]|nr:type II toxin-antitoxin system VapC family toxin [Terriglobales bacterium]